MCKSIILIIDFVQKLLYYKNGIIRNLIKKEVF